MILTLRWIYLFPTLFFSSERRYSISFLFLRAEGILTMRQDFIALQFFLWKPTMQERLEQKTVDHGSQYPEVPARLLPILLQDTVVGVPPEDSTPPCVRSTIPERPRP